MPKKFAIALFLSLLTLTACTTTQTGSFTAAEVAKHASASDCWMIISNKVYNVTDYVTGHPGGDVILEGCGKDATILFMTQGGEGTEHSSVAESLLRSFYIGDLVK